MLHGKILLLLLFCVHQMCAQRKKSIIILGYLMFNGRCESIFHSFHVLIILAFHDFWGFPMSVLSLKNPLQFLHRLLLYAKTDFQKYIRINNDLTSCCRTQQQKKCLIYCILGRFFCIFPGSFFHTIATAKRFIAGNYHESKLIFLCYLATLTVIIGLSTTIKMLQNRYSILTILFLTLFFFLL